MPEISARLLGENLGILCEKLTELAEEWAAQQAREIPPGINESMQDRRIRSTMAEAVAGDLRIALLQLAEGLDMARKGASVASQVVQYAERKTRAQSGDGLTITY